jgi:hypothetical protein
MDENPMSFRADNSLTRAEKSMCLVPRLNLTLRVPGIAGWELYLGNFLQLATATHLTKKETTTGEVDNWDN